MMGRREKLLCGLGDLKALSGIEIGALHNPFVTPDEGPILYIDHATTEELRAKYAGDPGVDVSRIVEVGAV